ncbi:MAG: hypothetical protein KC420_05295 [Myxococcales bacterium]|nr:hypothetical protein [Myxococcales bacterium]MCB9566005.1 hypothetical protein [Myxococcales bacterium]MCB9702814.1 hypothetical protein [Myxococcales bacterium]
MKLVHAAILAPAVLALVGSGCPTYVETSATAGDTQDTSSSTSGDASASASSTSTSTSEGSGSGGETTGGGGPEVPEAYGEWLKREPPGALCSNGSQYKFFVNFSETSDNLLIYLEPGGACWDYETCSGSTSLGAANPDGIPDAHMKKYADLSPILRRDVEDNPARDWNLVFIPYCTGDVHTGNKTMIYEDPEGKNPPLTYIHNGHNNIMAVVDYLNTQFPHVGKMMLTGCSAGGAGSLINYYFFRNGIEGVDRGYLMDDSGPIFPSSGYSGPLHAKIRGSWDVDPILESIPEGAAIKDDFGNLNVMLASIFPDDRLSTIYFKRDYNFSRYSYERFYPDPSKEQTLSYWAKDSALLTEQYDEHENLAYYIPYWREFNDSHCLGIVSYLDTDIPELDMTLPGFIDQLLDDDAPLESYEESDQPGEDL